MTSRYSLGVFSPRTIEVMARGCTDEQWSRQCLGDTPLQTTDDTGALLTGEGLYQAYRHLCIDLKG